MLTAREKAAFFMGSMSIMQGFGRGDVNQATALLLAAAKYESCDQELREMVVEFLELVGSLRRAGAEIVLVVKGSAGNDGESKKRDT